MAQTNEPKYAPGYDLFKLIVAVILTIILILLLLRESRGRFAQPNLTAAAPTETERVVLPTMTSQPPPSPTLTSTPTPLPTSTEPALIEPTPTESASAETVVPTEPIPASDPKECPTAPTRIQDGDNVRVVSWLYFRTGPGLNSPIQHTNKPGTEMGVIGGPVCTTRSKTDDDLKAYLWWNVRMKNGQEGWSAEAPLNFPNYFLEPLR